MPLKRTRTKRAGCSRSRVLISMPRHVIREAETRIFYWEDTK